MCSPSLSSGLAEMISKYSVLWEGHGETPDKESFSSIANFYKIDGEILEAEQKMYMSFLHVRRLGYMTVPEMLETMHKNDLFDMLPVFSNVVHIFGMKPATLPCVLQNDHSVRWADRKLTSAAPWDNNMSVILHLLTLKGMIM